MPTSDVIPYATIGDTLYALQAATRVARRADVDQIANHTGRRRMYPFVVIAGAMTLFFLVAVIRQPRAAKLLAVVLWAAFAVYEYFIANGTLCDANCNIRVDLILFIPVLGFATYLGLKREARPRAVAVLAMVCLALAGMIASMFSNTVVAVITGAGALVAAALAVRSSNSGNRG